MVGSGRRQKQRKMEQLYSWCFKVRSRGKCYRRVSVCLSASSSCFTETTRRLEPVFDLQKLCCKKIRVPPKIRVGVLPSRTHTHTHARTHARTHTHTHTHTHTQHTFNGPFSGTTRVSQYEKGKTHLDFTEARDSEWQWHQLGHMQVCILLQTDNHASTPPLSFLQAGCPSCRPTNSVKALKAYSCLYILALAKCVP